MDDLIGLLVIIAIAIFNMLAQAGKKKKPARPAQRPGGAPPKRAPATIEDFFEELAEKMEPKQTELPDWPKGYERPDYMKEMEDFERARAEELEEEKVTEPIPVPEPNPEPALPTFEPDPAVEPMRQVASLKSAMRAVPSAIINTNGMRIATAPMLRSSTAGKIDYPLGQKSELKKAIIAKLIFSPPRACDPSFDNTSAK